MNATLTAPVAPADERAQAERDAVAKGLRRYADRKRPDHAELLEARAKAVEMAVGYTELDSMGEPRLVDPGLYSALDVIEWVKRALDMGATMPRIGGDTIERLFRCDLVPNAIFREAVEERGLGMKALAELLGMEGANGLHICRDLERQLGIATTPGSHGYQDTLRLFITHDQAVAFAAALGLEPAACGV